MTTSPVPLKPKTPPSPFPVAPTRKLVHNQFDQLTRYIRWSTARDVFLSAVAQVADQDKPTEAFKASFMAELGKVCDWDGTDASSKILMNAIPGGPVNPRRQPVSKTTAVAPSTSQSTAPVKVASSPPVATSQLKKAKCQASTKGGTTCTKSVSDKSQCAMYCSIHAPEWDRRQALMAQKKVAVVIQATPAVVVEQLEEEETEMMSEEDEGEVEAENVVESVPPPVPQRRRVNS